MIMSKIARPLRKAIFLGTIAVFWLGASQSVKAQGYALESWKFQPQIGIWFGPVTPFPGTALSDKLNTNLGGGMFFRFNIPNNRLRSEIGISYSYYNSDNTTGLEAVPIYGALAYRLPLNLPIAMQVKGGAGSTYVFNDPERHYNWLPTAIVGYELSFPAGKWVNIGLRADYYFLYEQFIKPPADNPNLKIINGHLLNFGLMVNFNLNP